MCTPIRKSFCPPPRPRRPPDGLTLLLSCYSALALGGRGYAAPEPTPPALAASPEANPPADGFNRGGSDPAAISIADATMVAMGGRLAWDNTRYLIWRFFGHRLHIWDRFTERDRIEYTDRKSGHRHVLIVNLKTRQGQVFIDGKEVSDAVQRTAALKSGLEEWINDSYWLIMPYKLKDSGVTLRYKGRAAMADGRPADVLVLTFAGVGVTPQNKYDVYVAKGSGLIEQWAYYEKASDPSPQFMTPWAQWRRYGKILLSGDRGKEGSLTDLAVLDAVPDSVFQSPSPVDLKALGIAPK